MSLTPDEFMYTTACVLAELRPNAVIRQHGGFRCMIDNQQVNLENLYRMVLGNPSHSQEIIRNYCEEILKTEEERVRGSATWIEMKPRIMPRIHPNSILKLLPGRLAYRPWVNDTVIAYVCDTDYSTYTLEPEQVKRWGVQIEDLESVASENLSNYSRGVNVVISEGILGGKVVSIREHDSFDSSRILLPGLRAHLAAELGNPFYVGLPARDFLVAFSFGPDEFVETMRLQVEAAFKVRPYPISPHLFVGTLDGVAGTLPNRDGEW